MTIAHIAGWPVEELVLWLLPLVPLLSSRGGLLRGRRAPRR